MPNIICRGLSFGYDGSDIDLFTRLDLTIDTQWRTALVGRNGRGKTTLMRLLAGELQPDNGEIERPVVCRLFSDRLDQPEATAWEVAKSITGPFLRWECEMAALLTTATEDALARYGELQLDYTEQGGYQIDACLERELDALAIDPALRDRSFNTLSGGEQTRCLLAGLFASDAGYALIDEPTNHLDMAGRRRLAGYLAGKSGFLLVSHDRAFLDACADHVIALNPDTVDTHRASYSVWRQGHLARLAEQARANEMLKKEIRRLEDTAAARRQGADAREADKTAHGRRQLPSERGGDKGFIGARAARQMKRAMVAERRAEQAADSRRESLTDLEKHYPLKLTPSVLPVAARSPLLRATGLTVLREGQPLFEPVSFTVLPGERLAVLGPNGCGKTTLLDLLSAGIAEGHDLTFEGRLERSAHLQISKVSQQPRWRTGLLAERLAAAGLEEARFRQIMAALGVRGTKLEQPLEQLSQGQLKKVELARSLIEPAHLLIWDEPLNYIDVETREQIEVLLQRQRLALICVEHDAHFVEQVATEVVRLRSLG